MRVVVVGAGVAGLGAAQRLAAKGHDVTVFDKGRSPGGRLATRRIGTATLDHGAQFFTIRSEELAAVIAPHRGTGLVYEWCRGFVDGGDGYPRFAVRGGVNALAKAMAAGLDVRTTSMVFAIRAGSRPGRRSATMPAWHVALDDGTSVAADAVVVTCPLPQSYSLLVAAEVDMPVELIRTEYDRTIALLVTLDRAPMVPDPGGMPNPTDTLSFVTDNRRKGISATDALTVHANAAWSAAHWDDDHDALERQLRVEAAPFIGDAAVLVAQIKKWRFATPRTLWPAPCWSAPAAGPLVLAGDAFAGPKQGGSNMEGAVLSGLAAADQVLTTC